MKNKGFTLVELITTFALVSVIVILLINIIVIIKNVYSNTDKKTELYINQSNLSNVLNKKFSKDNLISYRSCDNTLENEYLICQLFTFKDSDNEIKLSVTPELIKFGNYAYPLDECSVVKNDLSDELFSVDENNDILNIKIPIYCEMYPEINFGINLVYLNYTN